MQLDYRHFVMKLERIAEIKPLPYQDHVVNYVKAYYIPEADLEQWVKLHEVGIKAQKFRVLKYVCPFSFHIKLIFGTFFFQYLINSIQNRNVNIFYVICIKVAKIFVDWKKIQFKINWYCVSDNFVFIFGQLLIQKYILRISHFYL